jgi:hypothetical protein
MAGLVCRLVNVEPGACDFPRRVAIRRDVVAAVGCGVLPPESAHTWVDTGVSPGEVYVKISVGIAASDEEGAWQETTRRAREVRDALLAFLRVRRDFSGATLVETGELSARGGSRCVGEYELSVADVRNQRQFTDAACRCSWPIEHWHPVTGVRLEYLQDDGHYEIPLRSLKLRGFANVWCAGKCLSADILAQASARIAGCCWATGEAAGRAAAFGAGETDQ